MKIKKSLYFMTICVLVFTFLIPKVTFAEQSPFTRTLKVGMSGEDVRLLQKILNSDTITRVSIVGPGSSGHESTYFGALTQKAVIRFQEKYKNEILIPNSLSFGTGLVGPSTIAVLNGLNKGQSLISTAPIGNRSKTMVVASTSAKVAEVTTNSSVKEAINPNLKNLDTFIATVDKVSKKKGLSTEKVASIKNQIYKDVATTTDLRKEFEKLVGSNRAQLSAVGERSLFASAFDGIYNFISKPFKFKKARAITGTPFGGALLYSYYCTCSENWLITLEPLPPTFVALLTYTTGSQAFLTYNIPETSWLLGEYNQNGQCSTYVGEGCIDIPAEGNISPTVGSSME